MKLGMIAMSGVRAHNPELTRLGLTLPGFVERNQIIASLPSLGLLTLAALTPSSIDIEYLEVDDLPSDAAALLGEFDAVAISSFSARIQDAYKLADQFRIAGVPVILGGLHVTACPDEARAHADAIVLGEGEPVWPQLIADLNQKSLQPVYDARGRPFDLSQAPIPRFELLDPAKYNRITVQTARGCPFDCEFCAASIRLSPGYRLKPVDRVMREIDRIQEIWPHPFLEFADDNSFAAIPHAKKLLRALAGKHVRWFTETDVSVASDTELLGLMRDSGCAQVLIGFESPTRGGLKRIERKTDWKARQFDHYVEAVDRIQRHGITVNGCFILGLDGTGPESFQNVLDFVEISGLYEVQITVLTPFPGTPLYDRLRREGRLLHPQAWNLCTLFDVNFQPQSMSVRELEVGLRWLAGRLYSADATERRRKRFLQRWWNDRHHLQRP